MLLIVAPTYLWAQSIARARELRRDEWRYVLGLAQVRGFRDFELVVQDSAQHRLSRTQLEAVEYLSHVARVPRP